jgi:transcriptional regulator with XRE-family HTH domain
MKGEKKTPKSPGFMRAVVGSNVGRLLDHHYSHLPSTTQRQRALAKDSGVGFGTVQRIMKREVGASLDNLESIADALQIQMYQLMLPALDVKNPQVVHGASEAEQRMYRLWKRTGTINEADPQMG